MASYRGRLRREGFTLAACGLIGAAVLLAVVDGARDRAASTVGQLLVVLVAMTVLGVMSVRRALREARELPATEPGSGEPTPLWQLPLIASALSVSFGMLAGWDAAVRVAGGCAIVGLVQAVILERIVAAAERGSGRRYVRVAGSRIVRGSRLGYTAGSAA